MCQVKRRPFSIIIITSRSMALNSLSNVFLFRACCSPLFIQQQLFFFPKIPYYWMSKKGSLASCFALTLTEMLIRISNCNLLLNFSTFTTIHSPPFIHQNLTTPKVSLLTVCLKRCLTLMDQIIATWFFFQVEVNFFPFLIFFLLVWFICNNYVTSFLDHH